MVLTYQSINYLFVCLGQSVRQGVSGTWKVLELKLKGSIRKSKYDNRITLFSYLFIIQ